MSQTSLVESSSSSGRKAHSFRLDTSYLAKELKPAVTNQLFRLSDRYIFEESEAIPVAVYHVVTHNTKTGQPHQLQISRLLPSETRRLSVAAANNNSGSSTDPFIRYDDDLTLYFGQKINVPFSIGTKPLLIIRGQKRGTIQGSIVMEKSGRSSYSFWHLIPIRRAQTQAENERMQALMHKRGYKDSDDWNKKLLLTVSETKMKGTDELEWTDELSKVVATEKESKLEITNQETTSEKRDLVVACWACKNFVLKSESTKAKAAEDSSATQ